MATTAENLEQLKKRMELSDAEMARRLNLSLDRWTAYVSGRQKLTRAFLEQVAKQCNTTVDDLIGDERKAIFEKASNGTTNEKLRALEQAHLYQHNDMAAIVGKSKRTWAAYLDGTRNVPEDVLFTLAGYFQLPLEKLKGPEWRPGEPQKAPVRPRHSQTLDTAPLKPKEPQDKSEAAPGPVLQGPAASIDQDPILPSKTAPAPKRPGTHLHFRLHIQAQSGEGILAQSLLDILPVDATDVYVKAEEGKAYWTGNGRMGFVNLW